MSVRKDPPTSTATSPEKKARTQVVDEDFDYPSDWPKRGEALNLDVQDLPHRSSATEWWYTNGHLKSDTGLEFSFFSSFFKLVTSKADDFSWAVTWAIVDPATKKYHYDPIMDPIAPQEIRAALDELVPDGRLRRAMKEVVDGGNVPLPDRIFKGEKKWSWDALDIDLGGNRFHKDAEGNYHLRAFNEEKKMAANLKFVPQKKAILQGHDGIVKVGVRQETMFYYYIPRHAVTGTVTVDGVTHNVSGSGWYDHEFGGLIKPKTAEEKKDKKDKKSYAWSWFSGQLEDGTDITATLLSDRDTKAAIDKYVVVSDKDQVRTESEDLSFTGSDTWMSIKTTQLYPQQFQINSPEQGLALTVKASFPRQEFLTLIAAPAFWEGRVEISGTRHGKPVKGLGFVEYHGFDKALTLDVFFKRISKQVQQVVSQYLPVPATFEQVRDLMADEPNAHLMDGADTEVFTNTIIKPIREIVDRGGKSWRSYALCLAIDAVGGESEDWRHALAMPEIMHVGSLIVDDIQDKSDTRRGGPSCHLVHGDAIAINAGTAAYFMSLESLIQMSDFGKTPDLLLKLYQTYFLTLRAAHAGQAFDIKGLDHLMPEAVESGDNDRLVRSVKCTHRLKSAVPAASLARIGAMIGRGTKAQEDAIAGYFESIGLAFQIIDDVLNLRGFEGNTKHRGEDICAGKVTYPVAKAMGMVKDKATRQSIWSTIQSKPQDQKVVEGVIEVLEKAGAIAAAENDAETMVEEAWANLRSVVPDSFFTITLRAFGSFVLQRHY